MTNYSGPAALALLIGLALVLAGCGAKDSGSSDMGSTANVTFHSEPIAEVWIDGKASGSTPVVIALGAGSHDIALKRSGFHDLTQTLRIEAGKHVTVEGTLPVAGSDETALKRLLAMVGEKHEPFVKPRAHRGAGSPVTLYFPSGDVRRSGLGTYRIEVDGSYDYDGFIEFRKGSKIVHREKFEPQTVITEKALPAAVLEAARNGTKLSWGLTFDGKNRKKDAKLVDFKIIPKGRERKVAKDLHKLLKRKAVRTATPLMREMVQIDYLKNRRLYSEVLVRSLGVLNTWDSTLMPYRNMVDALQRLKLKDSSLYDFAASKISGGGGGGRNPAGRNPIARRGATATAGRTDEVAKGPSAPLPPSAQAPRVRTSERSSGMQPAPGVTTRPTADAGASGPAGGTDAVPAPDSGAGTGGVQADPNQALRNAWREAELRAAQAEELEARLVEIDSAVQQATEEAERLAQARDEERDALEALESSDPNNETALEQARDELRVAEEDALQAQEALERAHEEAARETDSVRRELEALGPAGDARATADELRTQIPGTENPAAPDGTGQDPAVLPVQPDLDPAARALQLDTDLVRATDALDTARNQTTQAEQAADQATQAREAAEASLAALRDSATPPTPEVLQDAEAALRRAESDEARAAMDIQRAQAAVDQAEQDAEEARRAKEQSAEDN